ncbi:hypothetical protein Q9233_005676 [Columba guinea]|nr:hypothetical protein Q9233_005676 [Columba guinea]
MAWSDSAAAEEKEGSRSSSSNLKTTQGLGGGNGEAPPASDCKESKSPLLGTAFQVQGKGCDEETGGTRHQKWQDQLHHNALDPKAEGSGIQLWYSANFKLPVIYQKPPTLIAKVMTYGPQQVTLCYVMPSSSARCAQFPHPQDKVHYYIKLKDLRDQLKGIAPNTEVQEVEYTFDLQLAQAEDSKKMAVKEEKYDPGYKAAYGGASCDRAPYERKQCHFSSSGIAINPQCCEGSSFGEVPNGQWMTQSFEDQIPEFGAGLTQEEVGSGA